MTIHLVDISLNVEHYKKKSRSPKSLGFIFWSPCTEQLYQISRPIHRIVEIFHKRTKCQSDGARESQGITKVRWFYPLGIMHVCTKCLIVDIHPVNQAARLAKKKKCVCCQGLNHYPGQDLFVSTMHNLNSATPGPIRKQNVSIISGITAFWHFMIAIDFC